MLSPISFLLSCETKGGCSPPFRQMLLFVFFFFLKPIPYDVLVAPLITSLIIPIPYGVAPNGVIEICESNHPYFFIFLMPPIPYGTFTHLVLTLFITFSFLIYIGTKICFGQMEKRRGWLSGLLVFVGSSTSSGSFVPSVLFGIFLVSLFSLVFGLLVLFRPFEDFGLFVFFGMRMFFGFLFYFLVFVLFGLFFIFV